MHDTCHAANAIARTVRVLRDDSGRALYGAEEWGRMVGNHEREWLDYLCGNHSRNLHFDAYLRLFSGYIKASTCPTTFTFHSYPVMLYFCSLSPPCVQEKLGPALEVVRVKSGGRVRVEPGGDAFIRTVCKLTHVGPKQYAKGWSPNPNPNS
jgi:hypothetical protein